MVSKELLAFSGPGASLFQQELRDGVIAATDAALPVRTLRIRNADRFRWIIDGKHTDRSRRAAFRADAWRRLARIHCDEFREPREADDQSFIRRRTLRIRCSVLLAANG